MAAVNSIYHNCALDEVLDNKYNNDNDTPVRNLG